MELTQRDMRHPHLPARGLGPHMYEELIRAMDDVNRGSVKRSARAPMRQEGLRWI